MPTIEIEGCQIEITDDVAKLREEAIAEGYIDEICPECKTVLLANQHFVRCDSKTCPMSNGKSILEMTLEGVPND